VEPLARIPQDRIAVLIGKGGETRRMLEEASGATIEIDSKSGEVMADWGESEVDPVIRMKMPEVIVAIGRGLAPKRAVQLIEDEVFLKMYDIRDWVGRQPNQTRRMRSRLIGRNGRIRTLIEEISNCEMAIYGSTVLVIGDEDGLALANPAIEGILRGSEHSTVLHGLEPVWRATRSATRTSPRSSRPSYRGWLRPAVAESAVTRIPKWTLMTRPRSHEPSSSQKTRKSSTKRSDSYRHA
jgi:ribosomal RNA assembly protein